MKRAPALLLLCAFGLAAQVITERGGTGVIRGHPGATGKGSIEGIVINEVTREPIRKAQVTSGLGNVPPAVTDGSGRFVFRNLPPGSYMVQAVHPGFLAAIPGLTVQPAQVTLEQDEQKRDVVIPLVPGASISGRIVNENDRPLAGCFIQTLQYQPRELYGRVFAERDGATSDDRGRYRIHGLPKGRYYLLARCDQPRPAPHAFVRRGTDDALPVMKYLAEFYPGSPALSGAARLKVEPGANLEGMDFRLSTVPAFNVRGRFTGDTDALQHNLTVQLMPRDPSEFGLMQYGAGRIDARAATFRIDGVVAGAYILEAGTQDPTHAARGRINLDVGDDMQPVEVALLPGAEFTGSIEIESDRPAPFQNAQVRLTPLESASYLQSPFAEVAKDGSFTLSGVLPLRWRLDVNGITGYVKSVSVGGREVSPYGFDVAPGAGGIIRVVMGTKTAQMEGTVGGAMDAQPLWVMLIPEDMDRVKSGRVLSVQANLDGRFSLSGIEPGRYRACAFAGLPPWVIQQRPQILSLVRDRGTAVDLAEGASVRVQPQMIPAEDLEQMLQEFE